MKTVKECIDLDHKRELELNIELGSLDKIIKVATFKKKKIIKKISNVVLHRNRLINKL